MQNSYRTYDLTEVIRPMIIITSNELCTEFFLWGCVRKIFCSYI